MNMNFRTLAAFCAISVAFTGCSDRNGSSGSNTVSPLLSGSVDSTVECAITDLSASDSAVPLAAESSVEFSESGAAVAGKGITVSGNIVTITSAGVYSVTGSCSDGKIIIEAGDDDEVTLLLNGVELTSSNNSAIECRNAGKLTISLADGTENSLADKAEYTLDDSADEPDAAIYSRCDLIINGSGVLNVTGNYNDGIKCKDGLKICDSTINVTSANVGIKGRDYIIVGGANIIINSVGDGMKTTNSDDATLGYINITSGNIKITSGQDAIQAETEIIIDGGTIDIYTGSGSASVEHTSGFDFKNPFEMDNTEDSVSMKGIKSGTLVQINGGTITVDSEDDSIHSNGNAVINGGTLKLSTGDDGVHADENLTVSGGSITIPVCYEGLEGKSIDINDGIIDITSYDDGLNAAGGDSGEFFGFTGDTSEYYISIAGGSITVNVQGDGIDSNGSVAMSGGTVAVFGPTDDGNGALDYDDSFALSGGTLIALGSKGMAQAPSTLSQPCISIYADVQAGASIEVRNSDGKTVLSIETPKACQSLIFSSADLTVGETYTVYADDTELSSVTVTDGVSGNGVTGAGSFGNFGGNFGGGFGGKNDRPDNGGMMGGNPPERPTDNAA